MINWRPQLYEQSAPSSIDAVTLGNAVSTGLITLSRNPRIPPIFSLKHLCVYASSDYTTLRRIISRMHEEPYRVFKIRKRGPSDEPAHFRTICVPEPNLLRTQKWINENVLSQTQCHHTSGAYAKDCKIVDVAKIHCGSRWLVKLDIKNFFESISEKRVYSVFCSLGYQPLVAFELARLCTRYDRTSKNPEDGNENWRIAQYPMIPQYSKAGLGFLPQGAATSPMLSNLAMKQFDEEAYQLAIEYSLKYTRYADDLIFSAHNTQFTRSQVPKLIGTIYRLLRSHGVRPNESKTSVSGPGAKKLVLGLQVDGETPRLQNKFKLSLRQQFHFLRRNDVGPAAHAVKRGFSSVIGFKHHLQGLIGFASQIEPRYGEECKRLFRSIPWPL